MIKQLLVIRGDYNDADYVTKVLELRDQHVDGIKLIIDKIKKVGYTRLDDIETILDENEFGIFYSILPETPENMDIHTVVEISLYEVTNKEKLL